MSMIPVAEKRVVTAVVQNQGHDRKERALHRAPFGTVIEDC